jgi:DNA segregation ATPase FtsK/SpoIIIE-like protein
VKPSKVDVGPGAVYLGRPLARVTELFTVEDAGVMRVVWPHAKLPQGLLVGATGGGKTTLLRVMIQNLSSRPRPPTLCLADGIPDADSFAMFRGQPGIAAVASGRDETAGMVGDVFTAYQRRLAELGRARAEAFTTRRRPTWQAPKPLFLIVDEYLLWILGLAKPGETIAHLREIGLNGRKVNISLLLALQRAGVKDADTGLPGSLKAQLKMRIAATGEAGMDSVEARLAFDDDQVAKRVPMQLGAGYVKAGGAEGAFRVPQFRDPLDPKQAAEMSDAEIEATWAMLPRTGPEAEHAIREMAGVAR